MAIKTKNPKSIKASKLKFTKFSIFALALTIALVGVWASMIAKASAATTTTKRALIYGDSLTWESSSMIKNQFALHTAWKYDNHSFAGTAPCDWVNWLPNDLATFHPSIVAITTAGNVSISGCDVDANGTSLGYNTPAYYAKYQADLNSMFSQITATGAKVLFMEAPPFVDPNRNAAVPQIYNIAKTLAANYHGVSVSPAINTYLSISGAYTNYLPCLSTETTAMGCTNKQIAVRTLPPALDAGLHLCPPGLTSTGCPVYASGEKRFAKALVNTIITPPAAILP